MKSLILIILFGLSCSLAMGASLSDGADKDLSVGIELFQSGKYEASLKKLITAFETFPENLELNFFLGRAAFETGNYELAIMAFERILIASPRENRVKLEIARAFHKLGSNDTARQYCDEVLASDPPKAVKNNINQFLLYIDKTEQKHFFSGQLITGVDWNNNVWASPSASIIKTAIGDINLTGASSKKTQSWIANTTLGVNHRYQFFDTKTSWDTNITAYKAAYDETGELDIEYIGGQTGPSFVEGNDKFDFRLLLYRINLDNNEYLNTRGFNISMHRNINPILMISTGIKFETRNFPDNHDKDSINQSLTFNTSTFFKQNRLNLSVGLENENAVEDVYSYNRFNSDITLGRTLLYGIAGSTYYKYQLSRYAEPEVLFNKNRMDQKHKAGFSLKKKLWQSLSSKQNILLELNYQHTWALSNIDLYNYEIDIFQTSLVYNF